MKKMSKTAALAAAQKEVSYPIGSGTSWCIIAPYCNARPNGPSTEIRGHNYSTMLSRRAQKVAEIALCMMGVECQDVAVDYVVHWHGPMSAKNIVNAVLRAPGRAHVR